MATARSHDLPELLRPDDARWASRAAKRGEIRRLSRGLYTRNLDEAPEQLVRRRWFDVAALYFPGAVIVDRSATTAGPAADGSLFLDVGPGPVNPRAVALPGLTLRPRNGPGPVEGDTAFMKLTMSSPARAMLDNMRPSRARTSVPRTLRPLELEERLDRLARTRGEEALLMLRDEAKRTAILLDAEHELAELDRLIGSLLGTRDAPLRTAAARARRAGLGYDADRLALFETLRGELASQPLPERPEPPDPERWFAFFEGYFSNWIEGTVFEIEEAEEIVFARRLPSQRPADGHDVQGVFDAITDPVMRAGAPTDADALEEFLRGAHRRVMAARPEAAPGEYKERANRAGATPFVHPDLVRGTLREGFAVGHTLEPGLARAIFFMFVVAEVHPFADGNGRVARLLMNAELSSQGFCRVLIPLSYRDEYMSALRALSHNGSPTPLCRMIDRAQRWASLMSWTGREQVMALMERTGALVSPERAAAENVHLRDPA